MSLRGAGIEAFGDDVALLELPEPPPLETGQVLIAVKAAGVGNWEEFVRTGGRDVGRVPPAAGHSTSGPTPTTSPAAPTPRANGRTRPTAQPPARTKPAPAPARGGLN